MDAATGARAETVGATRAVVFSAINTLAIRAATLPALGPTDLLLRTHLTGIVPVLEGPLLAGKGAHLADTAYPLVPGYAAVGAVMAMGSAVPAEWHGAMVFTAGARAAAGMNAAGGTHGAHLVVPVDEAVRLPGIAPRAAIALTEVAMTLHALDLAAVAPGCRALVLGQGLSGQVVTRVLRARGAGRVIAADTSARRLAHTQANETIRLDAPMADETRIWRGERDARFDVLIDTTGNGQRIAAWLPALRRGGALVLPAAPTSLDFTGARAPRGAVRVVLSSDWTGANLAASCQLIATGAIALDDLISHTVPVARVGQAYVVALSDPDAMQVVLAWV